jgi:hypothetical protein
LIVLGHAVKTLESKETRASKKKTVTHNSVFAAHRLQCRMTIRKIDIRHFLLPFERGISRISGEMRKASPKGEWIEMIASCQCSGDGTACGEHCAIRFGTQMR